MRRLLFPGLLLAALLGFWGPAALSTAQQEPDEAPVPPPDKLDKVSLALDAGGHTGIVGKAFFTPDNKQIVTVSMDHTVRVWDIASGESVKVLYPPGFGGFVASALAPDGKSLAVASRLSRGGQDPAPDLPAVAARRPDREYPPGASPGDRSHGLLAGWQAPGLDVGRPGRRRHGLESAPGWR